MATRGVIETEIYLADKRIKAAVDELAQGQELPPTIARGWPLDGTHGRAVGHCATADLAELTVRLARRVDELERQLAAKDEE